MAELELNVDPSGAISGARRARAALKGTTDEAKRTDRAVSAVSNRLKLFAAAGTAATIAFVSRSVTAYRQYNKALTEVTTLIKGTAAETAELDKRAKELALRFGSDATAQASAFYQAISAGVGDVTDATKFLTEANKLAVGGVTDVTTAVEVLTTVTNAYSKSGLTAARASDILFTAVKEGKTTIPELSAALGRVVAIAGPVGISLEEITAVIATLTAQGQDTRLAVTGITAAISSIIDPSTEAAKLAKELGIEFGAAALEAKGLSGVLDEVARVTEGNVDLITRLVGGQEALKAVLPLVTTAADKYKDALKKAIETTGSAQEAFEKVSKSLEQRLNVQLAALRILSLEVGEFVLSRLVPALEFATAHSTEFALALAGIGAAVSFIAPLTGVIGVLAAAIIIAANNWGTFRAAGELALESVASLTGATTGQISSAWASTTEFMSESWEAFGSDVKAEINSIVGDWKAAMGFMETLATNFGGVMETVFVVLTNVILSKFDEMVKDIRDELNTLVDGTNFFITKLNEVPGVDIDLVSRFNFGEFRLKISEEGRKAGLDFGRELAKALEERTKDHVGNLATLIAVRAAQSDPRRGRGFGTDFTGLATTAGGGAFSGDPISALPTVTLPKILTDKQRDLVSEAEIGNTISEDIERNTFGLAGSIQGLPAGIARLNSAEQDKLLAVLRAEAERDREQTRAVFNQLSSSFGDGGGTGAGESTFGGPSSFTVRVPNLTLGGGTKEERLQKEQQDLIDATDRLSAEISVLNLGVQSSENDRQIAGLESELRGINLRIAEIRLAQLQPPAPTQIGLLQDNIRVLGAFAHGGSGRVPGSGPADSVLALSRLTPGEEYAFGHEAIKDAAGNGGDINVSVGGPTIIIQGGVDDEKVIIDNIGAELSKFADQIVRGLGEQRE